MLTRLIGHRRGARLALASAASVLLLAPFAGPAAATTPAPAAGQTLGVITDPFGINFAVFYQDADTGHLIGKYLGSGYEDLGGILTSGAAGLTVQENDGYKWVFVRGTSGAVYYRQAVTSGAGWFDWRGLGGSMVGTPTASCVGGPTAPARVWVRGTNNNLYRRILTPGSGWQNLGGQLSSDPGAVPAAMGTCPPADDVFVLGVNGAIYEWLGGRFRAVGGTSNATPAPVRLLDGSTWLFIRGATDNALWLKTRAAGSTTWSAWRKLGGVLDSAPTATLFRGEPVVVVRGIGNLYRGQFAGTSWAWYPIP